MLSSSMYIFPKQMGDKFLVVVRETLYRDCQFSVPLLHFDWKVFPEQTRA